MPILGPMEIAVVAAGVLILLLVPAVFARLDERRVRAAAATAPPVAIGMSAGVDTPTPVSNAGASDRPEGVAARATDPATEVAGAARSPDGSSET